MNLTLSGRGWGLGLSPSEKTAGVKSQGGQVKNPLQVLPLPLGDLNHIPAGIQYWLCFLVSGLDHAPPLSLLMSIW